MSTPMVGVKLCF